MASNRNYQVQLAKKPEEGRGISLAGLDVINMHFARALSKALGECWWPGARVSLESTLPCLYEDIYTTDRCIIFELGGGLTGCGMMSFESDFNRLLVETSGKDKASLYVVFGLLAEPCIAEAWEAFHPVQPEAFYDDRATEEPRKINSGDVFVLSKYRLFIGKDSADFFLALPLASLLPVQGKLDIVQNGEVIKAALDREMAIAAA